MLLPGRSSVSWVGRGCRGPIDLKQEGLLPVKKKAQSNAWLCGVPKQVKLIDRPPGGALLAGLIQDGRPHQGAVSSMGLRCVMRPHTKAETPITKKYGARRVCGVSV